ncbi:MAG: hypothetical protein JRD89_20380 [Deltaproteobacteria bacterium]|nr:hypothetical protein [Deltaproteobacteria bacterium]
MTLAPGKEVDLTDECLVKMGEVTLRTKKAERGLSLCSRNSDIVASYEHIGGPGSISYKDCASLGLPQAGGFHTHSVSDSRPSWWDGAIILRRSYRNQSHWLSCVGSPIDMKIRCYAPKELPSAREIEALWKERRRHLHQWMEDDPRLNAMVSEVAKFGVREIPAMLRPKVPVGVAPPAPSIRSEQVDFAESKFIKYIDEETGEVIRVERVF